MGSGAVVSEGFFVTLEGIEGCGKSTQAHMLSEALGEHGLAVVLLREPGSTPIGDRIREILLDREHGTMAGETEALLYAAARAQMVAERVRPALDAGRVVVCDRFVDSSIAYQAFGRGLPRDFVFDVSHWATGGLTPDLTLLLDLPVREGLARATRTACDRIEAESEEFHERVREGYLALADEEPSRIVTVDASGPVEAVAEKVSALVLARLHERRET